MAAVGRLQKALADLNPVHRMTSNRNKLELTAENCSQFKNLYLDTDIGQLDCLEQIEGMLILAPTNVDMRKSLSGIYARLGQADAAIREGRMAVDLTAKDRFDGPQAEENLARVYARLGRADDAVDLLEKLLRMSYKDAVTVTGLRLNEVWDPIRDDPRFQALLTQSG